MLQDRIPQPLINTGLRVYTAAARRVRQNTFEYTYDGTTFRYEYTNPKTFQVFWNLIDDGMLVAENLPLGVLDRGGDCDAVIDVGAHYGIYSVLLGQLNPDAQLYAYEPAPEPREKLIRNLTVNGLWPEAKVSDTIVSGRSGDAQSFYVDTEEGSESHSTTELDGVEPESRQTVALSDVFDVDSISRPFLKIDAEGEEGKIADDLAQESVTESVSGIIEIHPDKLQQYTQDGILETLRDAGYRVEFLCESAPEYRHDRPIYSFDNGPY